MGHIHATSLRSLTLPARLEVFIDWQGKESFAFSFLDCFKIRGSLARLPVTLGDAPVTFQNVGVGGARLDAGMNAMIWLKDGSKDTAARAAVLGTVADRWTTLRGLVVAVSKDGSTITLEEPIRARGEEAKRTDIKINVNTRVRFHGVGTGEAKIAEGNAAQVRLLDGSNDTAAEIHFSKPRDGRR